MSAASLADAFLKNRAEQLDEDVTGQFILPPFLERTPLTKSRQSMRIQGGRGCGKTIFLRAFCYPTVFSKKRLSISTEALSSIGLYWKPDIGFCGLMRDSWLGPDQAKLAFLHYAALVVLSEVCAAIEQIARANVEGGQLDLRDASLPTEFDIYVGSQVRTFRHLGEHCRRARAALDMWVQNPRLEGQPRFLRFEPMLELIAAHLVTLDERLGDVFFRLFIDEFENLQPEQRRYVCDAIKQPRRRFSVNFAMRRHAINHFETTVSEPLTEIHDYRSIDIEDELEKSDFFSLLAAELLLMRLANQGVKFDAGGFSPDKLTDSRYLAERLTTEYREAVVGAAKRLLPTVTAPQVADSALKDAALRRRLLLSLKHGLQQDTATSRLSPEQFVRADQPKASVVAACIVNRKQPGPQAVLTALESIGDGSATENPFTQVGGWVDNNLYGALFYLYIGLPQRPNPLYAGFDRYCTLARRNMRYFVQLCYGALLQHETSSSGGGWNEAAVHLGEARNPPVISVDDQALGARDVSEHFLAEVERSGSHGGRLLEIVLRLGRLFEVAQRRRSQSEPEINHFSIDESSRSGLSKDTEWLIREAKVQSVLYEEKDTKNKFDYSQAQFDLVPNPMFSPYFGVSYRKRRKLTLRPEQVDVIFTSSGEQFDLLLRSFRQKWGVDDDGDLVASSQTPSLFES